MSSHYRAAIFSVPPPASPPSRPHRVSSSRRPRSRRRARRRDAVRSTLPPLNYPFNALEPHIDAKTMEIHHDRHHAAYVTNLNNFRQDNPQLGASAGRRMCSAI